MLNVKSQSDESSFQNTFQIPGFDWIILLDSTVAACEGVTAENWTFYSQPKTLGDCNPSFQPGQPQ